MMHNNVRYAVYQANAIWRMSEVKMDSFCEALVQHDISTRHCD